MDGKKIDRKAYVKQIDEVYESQLKLLKESLSEARDLIKNELNITSPSDMATCLVASNLFGLKMNRLQGLARIDQMIAMAKMQEAARKAGKGGPCAGCGQPH